VIYGGCLRMQYMIERGHDGPARIGNLRIGEGKLKLPTLMGTTITPNVDSEYYVPGRDSPSSSRLSIAAPTFVSIEDTESLELLKDGGPILSPISPALSTLGAEASKIILDEQIERIKELKEEVSTSNWILRIPRLLHFSALSERISELQELAIGAVSFLFDGSLGPASLDNLRLRSVLPRNMSVIALGCIKPDMVPILYYFGFDIFDIAYAEHAASSNIRLWSDYEEDLTKGAHPILCGGQWCAETDSANRELPSMTALLNHNVGMYRTRLSKAVHFHSKGQLRWFVESSTHSRPSLASLLKRADDQSYDFIEEFTPIIGDEPQFLIGPESYNAPAIRRYRERLAERYVPPQVRDLVLLLPCSARKPYSDSRSHRRFDRSIERSLGSKRRNIAEVIISSPIGVVPRALERMYPVKNYDIPVTGSWDAEEIDIAASALAKHLEKFENSATVVAHVSGGYQEVVQAAEDDIGQSIIYTIDDGSATKRSSLEALEEVLLDLADIHSLSGGPPTLLEDTMSATLDFQFGAGASNLVTSGNASYRGRVYGNIVCEVDDVQMCTFVSEIGTVSLTLEGGERLLPLDRYQVHFDGEKLRGGSLFAIGISEADSIIRPGDEVLVVGRDGDLIAVGKSEMSGAEMRDFDNGMAINIRHSRS
jgi:archaeosine synthase